MVKYVVEPDDVRILLEWAGIRLLSMRITSPVPQGFRSYWPDYAADAAEAYGYTRETMRAAAVGPKEITIMDQILTLPSLITDIPTRRIVHKRSLVTPVSGRYVFSYTRLAKDLSIDARLAARLYLKGVAEIGRRIPKQQAYAIKHFLFFEQNGA
jgi:hypothetical protein